MRTPQTTSQARRPPSGYSGSATEARAAMVCFSGNSSEGSPFVVTVVVLSESNRVKSAIFGSADIIRAKDVGGVKKTLA